MATAQMKNNSIVTARIVNNAPLTNDEGAWGTFVFFRVDDQTERADLERSMNHLGRDFRER